jgi:hypothetical protein
MNRLGHLQETLPRNLAAASDRGPAEFVVLDYNSSDGLAAWVADALRPHLASGLVRYFRTSRPDRFRISHAKNVAHLLATGGVVCNVDADNFLSSGFVAMLRHEFERNPEVICHAPPARAGGAFGRIALRTTYWRLLGGYDESFEGYGYEDNDLIIRAIAAGRTPVWFDGTYCTFITHGDEERVRHQGPEFANKHETIALNRQRSETNVGAGRVVANTGRRWGVETVEGLDGEVVEVGAGPDVPDGWVAAAVAELGPAERTLYDRVTAQRWFTYTRIGHDSRVVELCSDFRIGAGRAGLERHWSVSRRIDGTPCIRLNGQVGMICELTPTADGYLGRWMRFERMPITLIPLDEPADQTSQFTPDLLPLTVPID